MPDDHSYTPRKNVLTEADIEQLKSLLACSKCAFTHDEADTLKGLAKNMNSATSLATKTIIAGMVLAFLSGTWYAIKHLVFEVIKTGAIPK
jgi:hypothetical protein